MATKANDSHYGNVLLGKFSIDIKEIDFAIFTLSQLTISLSCYNKRKSKLVKMVLESPLSNVQLELMKMFSHNLNDDDLAALKRTLANFFAEKASDEMDRLWEENDWSDQTMNKWLEGDKNVNEK